MQIRGAIDDLLSWHLRRSVVNDTATPPIWPPWSLWLLARLVMQASVELPFTPPPVLLDPLAELRRELVNWAEPVIADRIFDSYGEHDTGAETARYLAGQHRRLWRAILLQKQSIVTVLQRELQCELARAGLDPDVRYAIDQSVIEELIDIVLKRFRSSSGRVKGFSMILLGAASELSASRAVMHS